MRLSLIELGFESWCWKNHRQIIQWSARECWRQARFALEQTIKQFQKFRHNQTALRPTLYIEEWHTLEYKILRYRMRSKADPVKRQSLEKLMQELKIPYFSPSEEQFMKEYVIVMQSVVDGLNILQGDKNVGLGYLLPTLSVLKTNLRLLQDDPSIVYCQPLITSLLTSINIR